MNTDNTNSHIYINHSNYNECYGRVSIYRNASEKIQWKTGLRRYVPL